MEPIERLSRLFEKFPGIGPRQASRFVAYLLKMSPAIRREIIEAISQLGSSVRQCPECFRYFAGDSKSCGLCANPQRDATSLAVVASDADLLALERSGTFRGHYFVLGGTISLASEKTNGLRLKQLIEIVGTRSKKNLREVILAFPANPEGDATSTRVREEIVAHFPLLTTTALGRGLSTGSELEYADPETIKSALDSRR